MLRTLGSSVSVALRTTLRNGSIHGHAVRRFKSEFVRTTPFIVTKRYGSRVSVPGPVKPPEKLTFKQVEERVIKAVKSWDRFPQDKLDSLTMDSRFVEDLSLDSLDLVEVTMALEDEFEFEFPVEDLDRMKAPRDIYKYICEKESVFD